MKEVEEYYEACTLVLRGGGMGRATVASSLQPKTADSHLAYVEPQKLEARLDTMLEVHGMRLVEQNQPFVNTL